MDNKQVIRKLQRMDACSGALYWVRTHGGSSEKLWRDCKRPDWMFWLLENTRGLKDRHRNILFARWCARTAKRIRVRPYYIEKTKQYVPMIAAEKRTEDLTHEMFYCLWRATAVLKYENEKKAEIAIANYIRRHFKCPF